MSEPPRLENNAAPERSWTRHRPEPRNLWIRHRPRRWPAGELPFVDLAQGVLGFESWASAGSIERVPSIAGLHDVVYVPAAAGTEHAAMRRRLAEDALAGGLPVVLQVVAEHGSEKRWENELAVHTDRLVLAVDLTRALADGRAPGSFLVVPGAVAVAPLLPGLLDAERWAAHVAALAASGVAAVHLAAVAAAPATRRRLASRLANDHDYRALFHAPPLEERELARIAAAHGLATTVARPLPVAPRRVRTNRALAGRLAEAGELWSRLDPTGREAAPYFRAARFVDETPHDLEALARDGNLRVLEWLEPGPRGVVEEELREGRSMLAEELRGRWSGLKSGG